MYLSAGAAFAMVVGAPLSIAGYMGIETSIPGVEAAKSFLAMMTDRSPGERTKAELTKTKHAPAAAPKQRALGKITKPAPPPKKFVEALAPPVPKPIEDVPLALAPVTSLGPMLITPQVPGGIVIPPQSPPGGGGGPTPPIPEEPPTEPPTEPPPMPPVVPEPGTWATMLLGFGMTGWMIRWRRRKVAALQSA